VSRSARYRLFLVLLLLSAWAAPPALAGTLAKVAVVEFRAGSTGLPDVGLRLAKILRSSTSLAVLDPDDARRLEGAKVDRELARCAGAARCVATLGQRLGADEILLVGISQLGDLIITLQRIEARSAKVLSRLAESLPEGTEPDDKALLDYLTRLLPPAVFRRYGTLRVAANVDGAKVEVDQKVRGKTPLAPIVVLAPARLDVRVTKAGYAEFKARVDVMPEATVEVRPQLVPVDPRWYKNPWVWIVATTVVAGAATTAAILSRDEPTSVPVTVDPF
jgi:hypothetical protein